MYVARTTSTAHTQTVYRYTVPHTTQRGYVQVEHKWTALQIFEVRVFTVVV